MFDTASSMCAAPIPSARASMLGATIVEHASGRRFAPPMGPDEMKQTGAHRKINIERAQEETEEGEFVQTDEESSPPRLMIVEVEEQENEPTESVLRATSHELLRILDDCRCKQATEEKKTSGETGRAEEEQGVVSEVPRINASTRKH